MNVIAVSYLDVNTYMMVIIKKVVVLIIALYKKTKKMCHIVFVFSLW
jgi:hypothetical protein